MDQFLNEKPLISVIVPVYNGQDYLRKCIVSIEEQTYAPLQVIIINDGSTDRTGEVCRELEKEYQNIQTIEMKDEGVSAARNAGLDRAEGDFVTFVDADDRLLPETLCRLYECITETDRDIAGCGFFTWEREEELADRGDEGEKKSPVLYTPEAFLEEGILKGNSRCWSKLYRASAVGEQRFRQGITIGEDMLFLVDLLPRISGVAEISYQGYGYFQNPGGAMNRAFSPRYMDQITCWEHARDEILRMEKKMPGEKREQLQRQATAILLTSIMLTVGKLAFLPAKERKKQREYICLCHDKIRKEIQTPGAFQALSRGYRWKIRLFRAMPEVYLGLYHIRKFF